MDESTNELLQLILVHLGSRIEQTDSQVNQPTCFTVAEERFLLDAQDEVLEERMQCEFAIVSFGYQEIDSGFGDVLAFAYC